MKNCKRLIIKFKNGGKVIVKMPMNEDYKKYLDREEEREIASATLQKYPVKDYKKERLI